MAEKEVKATKDVQAFIVGALVILGLVFATYTYFNSAEVENGEEETEEQTTALDRIKDMLSTNTEREGTETEGELPEERASESETTETAELGTGGPITTWVANNYDQGDIESGEYTVVSGDTLWEIAEAVYGNGGEWTRILEANASSIGFLSNGQQSLIVAGQVLTLP